MRVGMTRCPGDPVQVNTDGQRRCLLQALILALELYSLLLYWSRCLSFAWHIYFFKVKIDHRRTKRHLATMLLHVQPSNHPPLAVPTNAQLLITLRRRRRDGNCIKISQPGAIQAWNCDKSKVFVRLSLYCTLLTLYSVMYISSTLHSRSYPFN